MFMPDLLTISTLVGVVSVVLGACYAVYKVLNRENSEEAFPNEAMKLFQPNTEKTKPKKKGHHHPKRKHSPNAKNNAKPQPQKEQEVSAAENNTEVVVEESVLGNSVKPKRRRSPNQKSQSKPRKEQEVKVIAAENEAEEQAENEEPEPEEMTNQVADELERLKAENAQLQNDLKLQSERRATSEQLVRNKSTETAQLKEENKKLADSLKQVNAKLAEKEKSPQKNDDELDRLRAENAQLQKEKKEQNERHVVFEQTVRNKLVETVQLKEENKKLADSLKQLNAKLSQVDQIGQKMHAMQAETQKAQEEANRYREECKRVQEYADKLVGELRKAQEEGRNMQTSYAGQSKAIQSELNKEREQRMKLEQDIVMAKQMMEKLATDAAVKDNQLREFEQYKAAYESKLQTLQSELNREKDNKMAWQNTETQLAEMTSELDKAMTAYQQMKAQQSADSAKMEGMVAENRELAAEIGRLQEERANEDQCNKSNQAETDGLKAKLAELNDQLNAQRIRTNEQREINYKLMETLKQLQATKAANTTTTLVNGTTNGGTQQKAHSSSEKENMEQLEKVLQENKQYKVALDSVDKQLEEVSRIAKDMEREKDAKIAQIEAKLTKLFDEA